jgi:hypothetical protein
VILFIEKTWWLLWIVLTFLVVRWFHLLSVTTKLEGPDTIDSEEETNYLVSWRLLRNAQPISLSGAKDAFTR